MARSKMILAAAMAMSAAVAPSAFAEDTGGGFTCGFVSTNDPTGVISQDPNKQTGEVNCGPFVVANTAGGAVTSVTITACFKVNDSTYGGGTCRSATVSGNVGIVVDTISYTAAPGDAVYIGTTFAWTSAKGGGGFNYDCDEVTEGEQTCLATSVEA